MPVEKHVTACTMDCPDTCSLEVHVDSGRISKITAADRNPTTQGFICTKVSRFAKRVYAKERLLYPMARTGTKGAGEFKRISWDEALETICSRFRDIVKQWGGEAVLPYSYGGSNGMLGQDTSDRAFFAKLGASQLARTVCAAPTTAAAKGMYGKMPGTAFEDYVHSRLIIIWGANPKASNIHLVPYLKKAKQAGAKIAVVDPARNFSEREIDLHLPVYPGTDLVVALAMINYWQKRDLLNWDFIRDYTRGVDVLLEQASRYSVERAADIARVEPDSILRLAEMYAAHDPAVIRVGWGLERNRNGGQAVAAVLALPALLGKFGLTGSGYTLSNGGAYKVEADPVTALPWHTRVVNMNKLGEFLTDRPTPPVKGLFVYNCNPAVTVPDQKKIIEGLAREDLFTVVSEQVMTDTASYADILLPAVTFLEQAELKKGYGAYALQYVTPVIDPVGEAKPNEEVFALLGQCMGWEVRAFDDTTEDYLRRIVRHTRGLGRDLDLANLREDGIAFFDFPGRFPQQFKTAFPWTAHGQVDFAPSELGENPYQYKKSGNSYPLTLISPATDKMISSTLGEFNFSELYVQLNPEDASSRNLKTGEWVRVYNELGEVHVRLKVSDRIRIGVASMPKGAWRKSSRNGLTATALAPSDVSEVGGGACFNDARVEIERLLCRSRPFAQPN